jgi:hypothetical protein
VAPRGSVPLVGELEARIDEALVIARASEEGVREVGEMALDAARQARRAAEAAERSAEAAVEAVKVSRDDALRPTGPEPDRPTGLEPDRPTGLEPDRPTGPVSDRGLSLAGESSRSSPPAGGAGQEDAPAPSAAGKAGSPQPRFEVRFRSFNERADRLSARLRALQDHRRHPGGASVGAARWRGDG